MKKVITEQSDWDDLLEMISDRVLTPVLGKEMYQFNENGNLLSIDTHVSRLLFEQNKITEQTATTLTQAVDFLEYEKNQNTIDVIKKLKSIVKEMNAVDFPLLDEFLSIKDLNYFVNTAVYNHVLENKIAETRKQKVDSINFSLRDGAVKDSDDPEKLSEPFVFNVFGSLMNTIDPALTEEDMLEYTGFFKEKISGATNIINALKNKNLLFLGCSFPEWMMRFSLRLLSSEPMHEWGKNRSIYIINDKTEYRENLYKAMKNYHIITYEGNTKDFVMELSTQWKQKNPNAVKNKMIFLSYTRDDTAAVENIKKGIESIGNITCWYDIRELEPGDDWEEKIVVNIRKADMFIPLISNNSLEHQDGYVHNEWKQGRNDWKFRNADKRGSKYLIPVVIDDSQLYNEKIAEFFDSKINIVKVPNGIPDPEFLNSIKKILELA
ncbi:MAG TPA: toll/interleukin-1 receptor domain-containing protein [Chitinophagaceae bacterium]|nr:toll/interleukin-1 receptor domain-containing protein [Chitinophagaceae bacterium]